MRTSMTHIAKHLRYSPLNGHQWNGPAIQNNLGKILIISGELENNPQRIEDGRAILSKYFKNAPENSVR